MTFYSSVKGRGCVAPPKELRAILVFTYTVSLSSVHDAKLKQAFALYGGLKLQKWQNVFYFIIYIQGRRNVSKSSKAQYKVFGCSIKLFNYFCIVKDTVLVRSILYRKNLWIGLFVFDDTSTLIENVILTFMFKIIFRGIIGTWWIWWLNKRRILCAEDISVFSSCKLVGRSVKSTKRISFAERDDVGGFDIVQKRIKNRSSGSFDAVNWLLSKILKL